MGRFSELSVHDRMSVDEVRDVYFQWLCMIVKTDYTEDDYSILLKHLHSREFTWFVPNDDNRASDGQKLREMFIDELGLGDFELSALYGPCSVLEMIIGLAIRIDDIMDDMTDGSHAGKWFWELIHNLGVDTFSDAYGNHIEIDIAVSDLLWRRYERNGNRGLFPLVRTNVDQRKVEIWYQMNAYLMERYRI